jgi:homoserine kinase
MMKNAAQAFFRKANCQAFAVSSKVTGDVPSARGLGSSATLRIGMLSALNELAGTRFSRDDLFALGAELEGHPDNAAPAIWGGFTVARNLHVQRFAVGRRLSFVLLVPDRASSTEAARRILPPRISRAAAVMSAGNAAAIAAAFASGNYELLRGCFRDGLHQPYRQKLVPHLEAVIDAAVEAGALGAFLSGSGSAICALVLQDAETVANAMLRASKLRAASTLLTHADNRGAGIVESNVG